MLIIFVSTAAK